MSKIKKIEAIVMPIRLNHFFMLEISITKIMKFLKGGSNELFQNEGFDYIFPGKICDQYKNGRMYFFNKYME